MEVTGNKDYLIIRELPTGKGYADIVLIPRSACTLPAVVLELKFDKSADIAISQIHNKKYGESLKNYFGDIVLVGINYDKKTKCHDCIIEKINKAS